MSAPQLSEAVLQHYRVAITQGLRITRDDMYAALQLGRQPYVLGRPLGIGAYGTVYLGIREDQLNAQNQDRLAIKLSRATNPLWSSALIREMNIVDRLIQSPHPNVIRFVERFGAQRNSITFIVMELAAGDLFNLVNVERQGQKIWQTIRPLYARHLIQGIADGIRHLFSLGISHGDLKLENVLISYRAGVAQDSNFLNIIPKLTDFNNSYIDLPEEPILMNKQMCSTYAAAPESIDCQGFYDMRNADIYSIGICLLALLIACHPFRDSQPNLPPNIQNTRIKEMKMNRAIIKELIRPFDDSLRELLTRTLEPEPDRRISIDEFLASDWINQREGTQELELQWSLGQFKLPQERPPRRMSI